MNVQECFQAGQLQDAVDAALADVKKHPTETHRRVLLCELLCYSGDLERADKQLDTLGLQDPEAVMGLSLFRQLIRAEQARHDFFRNGRVPNFLDEPTSMQQLQLRACIELREGNAAGAMELLEEAEEQRPPCRGTAAGEAFGEFRDLDDRFSSSLEIFTPNGKYYWIPLERLESLTFRPPQYPRDLLWRAAHMICTGGHEGEIYVPALYVDSAQGEDDQLKLGRATTWIGEENEPVRGVGQRMLLIGESDQPAMSLTQVDFEH
ncbi:MAG: hypothetical protein KDB14_07915 [Planctomycetales bacterium]|nr:hypothetical protein [Planctomycetales bacterium]